MAGEWLAATANANMFTYEIAPVFIMMEHTVLLKMREVIGWEEGDSILAPGGSISNMSVFHQSASLLMCFYQVCGHHRPAQAVPRAQAERHEGDTCSTDLLHKQACESTKFCQCWDLII